MPPESGKAQLRNAENGNRGAPQDAFGRRAEHHFHDPPVPVGAERDEIVSGQPFQDLFVRVDGRYAEELRISELVAFLFDHVNGESARAATGGD